jgi:hypothetical protein
MRRLFLFLILLFLTVASGALGAPRKAESLGLVPATELKFYFGNLHSHTAYSDGTATPKEAYAYARQTAHLDFLAITEHNHKKAEGTGYDPEELHIAKDPQLYKKLIADANDADQDDKFVAIYGQEYSTMAKGGNHTNSFMTKKVIATPNGRYKEVFTEQWMDKYGVQLTS